MTARAETPPCPTCTRPVAITAPDLPATFPFCSSRCRLLDLGKWADGAQVIPGQPLVYDAYGPDIDYLSGESATGVPTRESDE